MLNVNDNLHDTIFLCTYSTSPIQIEYAQGPVGHQVFFESTRPVHLANGQLDYLTIYFAHAQTPPYTQIGDVVQQGQLCYYTGTYGQVTGDHTHTCTGQGHYQGVTLRPTGHYDLTNRIHYWDGVYVNDTSIIQGFGHDWRTWSGPTPPPTPTKKSKFPWVLYANKLRGRNIRK